LKSKSSQISGSHVLIVDDHRNIRISLRVTLEQEGAQVSEASNIAEARLKLNASQNFQSHKFDLILLDIRLPDGSGLTLLEDLGRSQQASRVVVISGDGSASDAYRATQIGAFDFIEKPFTPERVLVSTSRCLEFNRIEETNAKLSKLKTENEIIGSHPKIREIQAIIAKTAPTSGRVLITGESGTGKELIARELHRLSQRGRKTMLKVNCAAIPKNLMESELFGHEKGAFTGATKTRLGVFERADGGTLFLDEIGELELDVQAKLLRVLQNGEFSRVGGDKTLTSDVRVICATNRDLKQMCQTGEFREDLFYRLNVIAIQSPALRERSSDIPELSKCFLQECCEEHSLGQKEFSDLALKQLSEYSWPGNVRELRNTIERSAIFSAETVIEQIDDLVNQPKTLPLSTVSVIDTTADALTMQLPASSWETFQVESGRKFLEYMLRKSDGNVSETARALDVERAYLHRLMKKLGIHR
jgi:two-component system nitrogen regulation response regulator NtrX